MFGRKEPPMADDANYVDDGEPAPAFLTERRRRQQIKEELHDENRRRNELLSRVHNAATDAVAVALNPPGLGTSYRAPIEYRDDIPTKNGWRYGVDWSEQDPVKMIASIALNMPHPLYRAMCISFAERVGEALTEPIDTNGNPDKRPGAVKRGPVTYQEFMDWFHSWAVAVAETDDKEL